VIYTQKIIYKTGSFDFKTAGFILFCGMKQKQGDEGITWSSDHETKLNDRFSARNSCFSALFL
jgi:hypothetical protein